MSFLSWRNLERGRFDVWIPVSSVIALLLFSGCNHPPQLSRVGEFVIADSIADYLADSGVNSPYFEVNQGQTLSFFVVAQDPDEDPVTLRIGPLPIGASFDSKSGRFAWTPNPNLDYGGQLELYIVAEDSSGAWDSVVVRVAYSIPP